VGLEPHEQIFETARAQTQRHVGRAEQRLEERLLKVAREGRHRADRERLARRPARLEGRDQLTTLGEDLLRVAQRDLSGLREHEAAPLAHEERLFEARLELLDLRGQRGLRHPERARRPREVPVLGDDPEVAEVVVVQLVHRAPCVIAIAIVVIVVVVVIVIVIVIVVVVVIVIVIVIVIVVGRGRSWS
jgi:hypothetical protein